MGQEGGVFFGLLRDLTVAFPGRFRRLSQIGKSFHTLVGERWRNRILEEIGSGRYLLKSKEMTDWEGVAPDVQLCKM